ncbi:hypothetical protein [Pseudochrobactrum sp. XF203]|uniref:hypothetical protein n=1 Tax=Pseudochrobactrum sp. XF203 TaxID=2879116 RepID=UPI001CE2DBD6|nr:hypothetical protein [Pseudochrobactrum sp. XF203]UCA46981.1 hypothetical protein LDL70_07195 [Pseudochrobactrum sp. XF203]
MRINKQKTNGRLHLTYKKYLSKATLAFAALLGSTPAFADGLDTAFYLASQHYAVLKRASIACDKPIQEHVDYKSRMLSVLSGLPNVDILSASQGIEQAYQTDAHLGGLDCTDALLQRYKQVIDRGVDRDLEFLADEVRKKQ